MAGKEAAEERAGQLELLTQTSRDTPMGKLGHLGPVLGLSETPTRWARPSVPLGHHDPVWPERSK